MTTLFNYKIKVTNTNVYDADTLTKTPIDLGFNIWTVQSLRLKGINAPEVRGKTKEKGLIARDALRELIAYKDDITIMVHGREKYGRWLITLYKDDFNINDWLIQSGYATKYMA